MRVLAIGDIHGCIEPFSTLLEKVKLSKSDKLILLGDYVDRGPDPKAVLDKIMELKWKGYDVITLRGNHEQMMINAFLRPEAQKIWMHNGGWETVKGFGCSDVKHIPYKYLKFLLDMPLHYEQDRLLFVHAGFNEAAEAPFIDEEAMLWLRTENYCTEYFRDRTVVHGHTPNPLSVLKEKIGSGANVINLDTGCVYIRRPNLGMLSAYDFTLKELFWAENN